MVGAMGKLVFMSLGLMLAFWVGGYFIQGMSETLPLAELKEGWALISDFDMKDINKQLDEIGRH